MANKSTKKNKTVIESTNNIESIETPLPTPPEASETFSPAIHEQPAYITFDMLKAELDSGKALADILTLKSYLPIVHKQLLIEDIINSAKEIDSNGMTRINYVTLEIFSLVKLIENYTNYAFTPDTMIDEVDYMIENRIIGYVNEKMDHSETVFISDMLEKEIGQEVKLANSMENILNNHLFMLQDKLEELFAKIPQIDESFVNKAMTKFGKIVGKFNPESVKEIKNLYEYSKGGK